jgi:phosphatidylethanolamine-binding protein (PEBP) family uncharacterized protein
MTSPRFTIATVLLAAVAIREAGAHPWHRHAEREEATPAPTPAAETPFFLTAARVRPAGQDGSTIDAAFAPLEKLGSVATRRDDRWFYVESNGVPDHPLMVGIRSWQQQVPLPQPYTGRNAWQIPLHPVRAATPALTKNRFLRGAIAVAVNGIPIFNPLNNRGEDALAIGELDDYGGHCGRADDYHYHVAPVHLEKVVGKGRPIAYALDGYPVYGQTEPDGRPLEPLDALGGHDHGDLGYHYHALKEFPHLIGGFRGEVVERDGQVDPQPRAQGVREPLPPLRGATIVGFEATGPRARLLTYQVGGGKGTVAYAAAEDGAVTFTFTDPSGRSTTETYAPRGRGPGGGQRGGREGRQPGGPPPRPDEERPRPGAARPRSAEGQTSARSDRLAAREIEVTSPAFAAGQRIPMEFTCDGAGVSPPIAWQAGPAGTKSYALSLWHESPDGLKSYWVVHDIPAQVLGLPKNARSIGTLGLNGKHRPAYDPMCSKGPGLKTYHVTVYALSALPKLPAGGATRAQLLEAIAGIVLAEGTLTFTYERGPQP